MNSVNGENDVSEESNFVGSIHDEFKFFIRFSSKENSVANLFL